MSDIFDHEADAWGSLEFGEDDSPTNYYPKKIKCKYCKATDVTWIRIGIHWRLFDKSKKLPHICDAYFKGANDTRN